MGNLENLNGVKKEKEEIDVEKEKDNNEIKRDEIMAQQNESENKKIIQKNGNEENYKKDNNIQKLENKEWN